MRRARRRRAAGRRPGRRADDVRELGLQRADQPGHAAAAPPRAADRRRAPADRRFVRIRRERAALGVAPPPVIGQHVAQQAVEPRDRRFAVAQAAAAVHAAHVRLLQDLLGDVAPADALLQESEEARAVVDQRGERGAAIDAARRADGPRHAAVSSSRGSRPGSRSHRSCSLARWRPHLAAPPDPASQRRQAQARALAVHHSGSRSVRSLLAPFCPG